MQLFNRRVDVEEALEQITEVNIRNTRADLISNASEFLTNERLINAALKAYEEAITSKKFSSKRARKQAGRQAIRPIHPGITAAMKLSSPHHSNAAPEDLVSAAKAFVARLGAISLEHYSARGAANVNNNNNNDKPPAAVAVEEDDREVPTSQKELRNVLLEWLEAGNEWIPSAAFIAHLLGVDTHVPYNAVHMLRKQGYGLEMNRAEGRYEVTERPEPEVTDPVERRLAELEQTIISAMAEWKKAREARR